MTDDVSRQAIRGAAYNTLGGYAMAVVGFFAGAVVLRLLDEADFGLFGLGMAIMLFFARIKLWGLNALIIAETEPDDLQISTQFWLSVALSTSVLLLIVVAQPLLRLLYADEVVLAAMIIAGLSILEHEGLASTPESMLARELRYDILAGTRFIATTANFAVVILIALYWRPQWALVAGYGAQTVLYCIGVWLMTPRRPRFLFSMTRARSLMDEGRKLLWGGIGTYLAYQYDDIAVGTLEGQGVLGFYNRAYNWSLIPMVIITGILGVSAPTYARVKEDRAALSRAVESMLDVIALIAVPASFGVFIIAHDFVLLYGGEKWLPAVPLLQILLLYSLFRPMNDSLSTLIPTLDRNEVQVRYGIIQSVTMLAAATGLTLLFGAAGAALAAGLTVVIGFGVLYQQLLREHVDIDYLGVFAYPLLGSVAATGITALLLAAWYPDAAVLRLAVRIGVFSAVYGGVLLVTDRERLFDRIGVIRQAILT